jgi:phosphatidyl-myo-inositol alpha-mannosyltransferase
MITYYLPGASKMGVGYQAHALANALVARGNRVTVFSSSNPAPGSEYETETIALRGHARTFKFAYRVRKVDWRRFDVIHAHGGDYLLFPRPSAAHLRTVHGSSLREAIHVQGLRQRLAMSTFWLREMLATAVADESIAVSWNTKRWRPWIRTVIPNGVDCRRFRPGTKSAAPSVLFVGTYLQRKRGNLLADVFEADVRPRLPDAELWMVADDVPIERPGVRVFARLADDELAALYRAAWVFCLPSTYEGFGIPYIEAMASGCPVVATRNAGAVEVTENGRYGLLVSDEELGSSLLRLLTSAEERSRLVKASLAYVRRFDLEKVAAEYEAVYRRLLAQRPAAP